MAIPQNFIQECWPRRRRGDRRPHVQLKKTGANFSGLCPFHSEKSPSFTVSPSQAVLSLLRLRQERQRDRLPDGHAGMNFVEAVKDLAGQYGMQVPEEDIRRRTRPRSRTAPEAGDADRRAGEGRRRLPQAAEASRPAVDYFKRRGVSGEIAKAVRAGLCAEGWRSLASVFPNYDDPLLAESGLVIVNEDEDKRYDRFRDRVMFPIRNVKGECIGFGGRVLGDEKPKYLNSPETPVFSKGRELYGLFEARNAPARGTATCW
jgi:DNA primase